MTVKSDRRVFWHRPWFVLLLVFFVALLLRIGHMREMSQSPLIRDSIPMFDSRYYEKTAREIAGGDFWGTEVFFMAPLYPYVLAIPYALMTSDDAMRLRYVQCIFGAVTCLMLCGVAYLMAGPVVGLIAGLIAALYGTFLYYDGILMPSTLTLGTYMLALLLLLTAARRGGRVWWALAGLALGICALAHGTALLFFPGVLLWIWFSFRDSPRRERLIRGAHVVVAFVAVIGAVTIRNYVVGHDFVLLTSNAGKNLYIGNNENATGTYSDAATYPHNDIWGSHLGYYMRGEQRTASDLRPSQMSAFFARKAREFVLSHPGDALELALRKARLMLHRTELGINDNVYFAKRYSAALCFAFLGFGLIAPLGLLGLVHAGRRRLLLQIFLASQFLAFIITFVLGRYRLAFAAGLIIAAAMQLEQWGRDLAARRYRPVLLSLIPLAIFVLIVDLPIAGIASERGFGQQYAQVGEAHLRAGEIEFAHEAFTRATTADFEPWYNANIQRAECYLQLGRIYEQSREPDQAREAYRRALATLKMGPLPSERMEHWLRDRLGEEADG